MTIREQVRHYTLAEIRNGTGFAKDARFVDAEIATEMLEALKNIVTAMRAYEDKPSLTQYRDLSNAINIGETIIGEKQ